MFFLYLFLWLIFSMRLNTEIAVAGAIVSAIVYWFAFSHMGYKPATDYKLLRNLLWGIEYVLILVYETAKATAVVLRVVFSRNIEVDPCIIYFRANLKTDIARVALANSITLTPGSITIALNDGLFCVFCMNGKVAEEIKDPNFALVRQLQKFEN